MANYISYVSLGSKGEHALELRAIWTTIKLANKLHSIIMLHARLCFLADRAYLLNVLWFCKLRRFPSPPTPFSLWLNIASTLLLLLLDCCCCCCYYDVLCYALPCTSQSITIETLQRNHQKYFAKYNRFGVLITSKFRRFLFFICLPPSYVLLLEFFFLFSFDSSLFFILFHLFH